MSDTDKVTDPIDKKATQSNQKNPTPNDLLIDNPYIRNGKVIPRTQKASIPVDIEKDDFSY